MADKERAKQLAALRSLRDVLAHTPEGVSLAYDYLAIGDVENARKMMLALDATLTAVREATRAMLAWPLD